MARTISYRGKDKEYSFKLKVDGVTYVFCIWVHVSRLKPKTINPTRPTRPAASLASDFDLGAALLPEDNWEPDEETGFYEVEKIHGVRLV